MEDKRLTGKSECGYNTLDACLNCDLEMDCGLCPYWAKALDRLAELEDKIEQGTLIELPILDEDILEDYAHRMFDSWNDITGQYIMVAVGIAKCYQSLTILWVWFTELQKGKLKTLKGDAV